MSGTEDAEPGEAAPADAKPVRKRRKKRRANVEREAVAAPAPTARAETPGSFYLAAAITVIAGLILSINVLSPTETPYAILLTGIAAFFAGAGHPRPDGMLRVCMALSALGLAGLATTSATWAIAAAVSGGIGLGGAIHRLGREGPETAAP